MEPETLHRPIAVFDAGIGSYAIVAEIQRQLPHQDIIYFADRASFPYGSKTPDELRCVMKKTLAFLETFKPSAVVVASNAPSITVLEDVRLMTQIPIFGVFPPLNKALGCSGTHRVGIMGVESLIKSDMLKEFVAGHDLNGARVELIDASSMVELVESGLFLSDPSGTQERINDFMTTLFDQEPGIDVLTLSSTHLPWLRPFFENAQPQCRFIDPAESVVTGLGSGTRGNGLVQAMVTENEQYPACNFQCMLECLDIELTLEVVEPAKD